MTGTSQDLITDIGEFGDYVNIEIPQYINLAKHLFKLGYRKVGDVNLKLLEQLPTECMVGTNNIRSYLSGTITFPELTHRTRKAKQVLIMEE